MTAQIIVKGGPCMLDSEVTYSPTKHACIYYITRCKPVIRV